MTKQAVLPLTWPHIKSDMPHTTIDKLLYFNHHWAISLYTCSLRPNNSMTITVNKWWLCNYLGPTYELPERNYPECASPLTLVRTEKVSIRLHIFFLKIYDLAVCVSISSFIVSSHVTSTFDNVFLVTNCHYIDSYCWMMWVLSPNQGRFGLNTHITQQYESHIDQKLSYYIKHSGLNFHP